MKYKLIKRDKDSEIFELEINELLEEGWCFIGKLTIDEAYYYREMVLYEKGKVERYIDW